MLGEQQMRIINKANAQDGNITKREAVDLIGHCYYSNPDKNTGDVLSRMVKNKILIRLKPGIFKVNTSSDRSKNTKILNPDQQQLF